jgi:hypothetical protein
MMLLNISVACLLFIGTTVIHTAGMVLAFRLIKSRAKHPRKPTKFLRSFRMSCIAIHMFLITLAEVVLWAVVYVGLGAIESFEKALYFSMVTFTTLGYGDIVLPEQWRLLSSFEAANGIIIFGWTTAIVIAVVERLFFRNADAEFFRDADAE